MEGNFVFNTDRGPEIGIMTDHQQGTIIGTQPRLQGCDPIQVQMVGGFIQEQQGRWGRPAKDGAEGSPHALSTRQISQQLVRSTIAEAKTGQGGAYCLGGQVRARGGDKMIGRGIGRPRRHPLIQ